MAHRKENIVLWCTLVEFWSMWLMHKQWTEVKCQKATRLKNLTLRTHCNWWYIEGCKHNLQNDNNSLTLRVLGHTLTETSTLTCPGLPWDTVWTAPPRSAPSMRRRDCSVLKLLSTESTEHITQYDYVRFLQSAGKTCKQLGLLPAVNFTSNNIP